MKYWNKDKRIRQEHWIPVQRNLGAESYATVKRRLQNNPSTGRFYVYYGSSTVWFENEKDALWFMLIQ
jgi:hypothetical protein